MVLELLAFCISLLGFFLSCFLFLFVCWYIYNIFIGLTKGCRERGTKSSCKVDSPNPHTKVLLFVFLGGEVGKGIPSG